MFCSHCGKPLAEDAKFCANCGKPTVESKWPSGPVPQTPQVAQEWEHYYYRWSWKRGDGGRYPLTFGATEYNVRLDVWGRHQNEILRGIQEYKDKGWQMIDPPGPGCFRFLTHDDYAGNVKFNWLEVSSFVVELRRPATPLKDKEKQLVGVWEEPNDPSKGLWNKLETSLGGKGVAKRKIEFLRNRTFTETNRRGEIKGRGVYYIGEKDEIVLMNNGHSDFDSIAIVVGNKLTTQIKNHGKWHYERAKG